MNKIHEGNNLRRIREILDLKQDALAELLGKDWHQQKVSLLEGKEVIDPSILRDVAKALGVTRDAIRNFNEQGAINYINSYSDHNDDNGNATVSKGNNCTFNPLDKLVEVLQSENKKKDELIERLLLERKAK